MTTMTVDHDISAVAAARKQWEAPAIVLERSLEVSAQGRPPGDPPTSGFVGPLGFSGGLGCPQP